MYVDDVKVSKNYIEKIYNISRNKYCRSLEQAQEEVLKEHQDVVEKVSEFVEPLI
jgi:hypothetical protein